MNRELTIKRIREVRAQLGGTNDGGDALVAALAAAARGLSEGERKEFVGGLVSLVGPNEGLAGVALDCLLDLGPTVACEPLTEILRRRHGDEQLLDHVAAGVLRIRCEGVVPLCVARIEESENSRVSVAPVIAALAPVDEAAFRRLSAPYVARHLLRYEDSQPPWLPTFVVHISRGRDGLLGRHIADVEAQDRGVATTYRTRLERHLSSPWLPEQLGPARVALMQAEVVRMTDP